MGPDLFLDPEASYQVAQKVAETERFSVSQQALRHQLRKRGLLGSTDKGRGMVQVRRTLDCAARQVLHVKAREVVRLDSPSIE